MIRAIALSLLAASCAPEQPPLPDIWGRPPLPLTVALSSDLDNDELQWAMLGVEFWIDRFPGVVSRIALGELEGCAVTIVARELPDGTWGEADVGDGCTCTVYIDPDQVTTPEHWRRTVQHELGHILLGPWEQPQLPGNVMSRSLIGDDITDEQVEDIQGRLQEASR